MSVPSIVYLKKSGWNVLKLKTARLDHERWYPLLAGEWERHVSKFPKLSKKISGWVLCGAAHPVPFTLSLADSGNTLQSDHCWWFQSMGTVQIYRCICMYILCTQTAHWCNTFYTYIYIHTYLDLPRGVEWTVRGAYTSSFRFQTASFGWCCIYTYI